MPRLTYYYEMAGMVSPAKALPKPFNYARYRGLPHYRLRPLGLPHIQVLYDQPARKRGKSKNSFFTLYDLAMPGIANLSKVPLRVSWWGSGT